MINWEEYNFSLAEFGYVVPEIDLLNLLQAVRVRTGKPIKITDNWRTPKRHIATYKKLEKEGKLGKKRWHDAIPWGSRHLPAFGKDLRAVDIVAIKESDKWYSGSELDTLLSDEAEKMNINIGLGIGKNYCHIDVDRVKNAKWGYNY